MYSNVVKSSLQWVEETTKCNSWLWSMCSLHVCCIYFICFWCLKRWRVNCLFVKFKKTNRIVNLILENSRGDCIIFKNSKSSCIDWQLLILNSSENLPVKLGSTSYFLKAFHFESSVLSPAGFRAVELMLLSLGVVSQKSKPLGHDNWGCIWDTSQRPRYKE